MKCDYCGHKIGKYKWRLDELYLCEKCAINYIYNMIKLLTK